jgi:hypothetical protein
MLFFTIALIGCGEGVTMGKSSKSSRGGLTGGTTGGSVGGTTSSNTGPTVPPGDPMPGEPEGGSSCDGSPGYSNSTRIGEPPPEGINLNEVVFTGSPNVSGWAKTATVNSVGFRPGTFQIDYSHVGAWAPYAVDIGGGTMQAATAWIFFYIDGNWYAAGGERLRPYQTEKNASLINASDVGCEWFYNPEVWGVMADYRPAPGEMVGFMVTSGSTRADNSYSIAERTNIVMIPFPYDNEDAYSSQIVWSE